MQSVCTFKMEMDCAACATGVESALRKENFDGKAEADFRKAQVVVWIDPQKDLHRRGAPSVGTSCLHSHAREVKQASVRELKHCYSPNLRINQVFTNCVRI